MWFFLYFFFRPFLQEAVKERKRLIQERRATAANSRISRQRAKGITWTKEEKEYLRQHAVSPYR